MDQELKKLVEKAEVLVQKRRLDQALVLVEEIIESGVHSADVFCLLGNIWHMKGKLGKALKAFRTAVEIDPKHTNAAISLSILYNDIGHYEKGKEVFRLADRSVKEKAGQHDPRINKRFCDRHKELGDLYFQYDRFEEALFEYNKAAALNPEELPIRIQIAKVLAKKGFVTRALQELRKLVQEYPDFYEGRVNLGLLMYSQGNIADAQTEWERVLYKQPHHPEAQKYLHMARRATESRV